MANQSRPGRCRQCGEKPTGQGNAVCPDCAFFILYRTCTHPDRPELLILRTANGYDHAKLRCRRCARTVGSPKLRDINMADVAAVIVNEPKGACARCGRTDAIERHHWAPVHLFPDAWDWPMSPLCPDCHRLWHTVTRTGASSTDRARGFDSYTAPEADLWDTDLKDGFGGAF